MKLWYCIMTVFDGPIGTMATIQSHSRTYDKHDMTSNSTCSTDNLCPILIHCDNSVAVVLCNSRSGFSFRLRERSI